MTDYEFIEYLNTQLDRRWTHEETERLWRLLQYKPAACHIRSNWSRSKVKRKTLTRRAFMRAVERAEKRLDME